MKSTCYPHSLTNNEKLGVQKIWIFDSLSKNKSLAVRTHCLLSAIEPLKLKITSLYFLATFYETFINLNFLHSNQSTCFILTPVICFTLLFRQNPNWISGSGAFLFTFIKFFYRAAHYNCKINLITHVRCFLQSINILYHSTFIKIHFEVFYARNYIMDADKCREYE